MAVVNIIDTGDEFVRFTIPASIAEIFAGKPVTFDPHTGTWLVTRSDLPRMTEWLRDHRHIVITNQDRPLPQPPGIGQVLDSIPPPGPGFEGIYARGAHRTRAALHAAVPAAAAARTQWAAEHPGAHPWSPPANRAAMQAAADAAGAVLDAIEVAELHGDAP